MSQSQCGEQGQHGPASVGRANVTWNGVNAVYDIFTAPYQNDRFLFFFFFRHIQQLHEKHFPSRKVMIGSTHIITPGSFLREISQATLKQK